jgi:hypothetical protein
MSSKVFDERSATFVARHRKLVQLINEYQVAHDNALQRYNLARNNFIESFSRREDLKNAYRRSPEVTKFRSRVQHQMIDAWLLSYHGNALIERDETRLGTMEMLGRAAYIKLAEVQQALRDLEWEYTQRNIGDGIELDTSHQRFPRLLVDANDALF